VLHAVPLGAYDNSLDNGPELGVAEVALAAAAALRTDVVGAVGGGPLAGVVVAGSAQTNLLDGLPVRQTLLRR
jgi:hypothetical protein